jgi:GABA permease
MWLYPYLTYFAIAAIGVVIVSMALVESVRSQLYLGLLSLGVVLAAYFIKQRFSRDDEGGGRFTRERDRSTVPVR